jgi:uncharacterized protein DUF6134
MALGLFAAVHSMAVAQDPAYGKAHVFAAYRNGDRIGSHQLSFDRDRDRLTVRTSVDLAVRFVGFTAYRYSHRSEEVWIAGELWSIDSTTDDDGKRYSLRAWRDGGGLRVERKGPGSGAPLQESLAAALLPSTHWNPRQIAQSSLLNSQKGTVERISVSPVGTEKVQTASRTIDATRYRYQGGLRMDQWFDASNRWVKTSFTASDGSTVEYVLQE